MSDYKWIHGVVADVQISSDTYSIGEVVTTDCYKTLYILDNANNEHCVVVGGNFGVRNGHKVKLIICGNRYVSIVNSTMRTCAVFSTIRFRQFVIALIAIFIGVELSFIYTKLLPAHNFKESNAQIYFTTFSYLIIAIGVCGLAYLIYKQIYYMRNKYYTKQLI